MISNFLLFLYTSENVLHLGDLHQIEGRANSLREISWEIVWKNFSEFLTKNVWLTDGNLTYEKLFAISFGVLVLIVLGLYGRKRYVKYLEKRIYFYPWLNLSKDQNLDIGESLSEILFFELDRIRDIHDRGDDYKGFWNQHSAVPLFEQSSEIQSKFLKKIEGLGFSGKLGKTVDLILFFIFQVTPVSIRGSIHKFGDRIRLQVLLEGVRDKSGKIQRIQCWKKETEISDLKEIPNLVAKLANCIFLELKFKDEFKGPMSFEYFTQGLEHHIAFTSIKKIHSQKQAIDLYKKAVKEDGDKNAISSYSIAELLYEEYKFDSNEEAITHYRNALRTSNVLLRAQAFRGLANAYCQKRQRHKDGDSFTLEEALRYANYAYNFCTQSNERKDTANVLKALAYACQVQSEEHAFKEKKRQEKREDAIKHYREAIRLNPNFTVAYNNLGYIYLNIVERTPNRPTTENGFSVFSGVHFRDTTSLAVKWRDAQDPLSHFLKEHLSLSTQHLLNKYDESLPPSDSLHQALIQELNQLLRIDSLYDERRFEQVTIREETSRLISQQPQGKELLSLNMLLLEDAYSEELVKSQTKEWIDENLRLAEDFFTQAVKSNSTYAHAYDNLGNVFFQKDHVGDLSNNLKDEDLRKDLEIGDLDKHLKNLESAREYYFQALDYYPEYIECFKDLSKLNLRVISKLRRIFKRSFNNSSTKELTTRIDYYYQRAWQYHAEALSIVDGNEELTQKVCKDFQEKRRYDSVDNISVGLRNKLSDNLRDLNCECLSSVKVKETISASLK